MGTAYLATGLVFITLGFIWVRRSQRARERWLRRLGLRGTWVLQVLAVGATQSDAQSDTQSDIAPIVLGRLHFDGDIVSGRYRLQLDQDCRWRDHWTGEVELEEGSWRLNGTVLEFLSLQENLRQFELRLLAPGSLGLREQAAPKRYYALQREVNNVVELPRHRQLGN